MKATTLGWFMCLASALSVGGPTFALAAAADNAPAAVTGATTPPPTAQNLEARQWFQDAKFGMFIHWGVYSVPARGEWVMEHEHIPVIEYEKFAAQFNPTEFDAARIVGEAKRAGMKYITVTSRHHDGFSMWPTKQNKWNIVDATAYKKDPLKQLADEAHRQGIKLFFYYSQMDWHSTDYWPLGNYGHFTGRPQAGDFNRYLDFMDAQLTELLTNYGDIAGIWFDGMWDKPDADWRLEKTYALIHKLQPAALVGSNYHKSPFPGEDFQMFEKDLPGANSAGFNTTHIGALPLETCETINTSWGYTKNDDNYKSPKQLIQYLVRDAGANANFLLNVGPTDKGVLQAQFVERLDAIGQWLGKHGDAIYGTRGGPISPRSWGVTTMKGNTVYVHVLDWTDGYLVLPQIKGIKSAKVYGTQRKLEIKPMGNLMLLEVPDESTDPIDRIIVLER